MDDQSPASSRNELLKHLLKITRHLLESSLYRLILALIKHLNKVLNGLGGLIELFSPLEQLVPLFGEVGVLLESFFVHVGEFFEAFVDGV